MPCFRDTHMILRLSPMQMMGLVGIFTLFVGCESASVSDTGAVSPEQLASYREKFISQTEPDSSLGVIELRESFPSDEESDAENAPAEPVDPADETAPVNPVDHTDVVVVGKVGGKRPEEMKPEDFPIVQNESVFYIVDPAFEADHDHGHGEDHDCPFCKAKEVQAQAIVRLVGDDGRPLPLCAKALLELEKDALVVVSGSAAVELDTLVITANKVFVRQ